MDNLVSDPGKLKEPRTFNGKPWYWCSAKTGGKCEPGKYRRHKPGECKGTTKGGSGNGPRNKKLKVAQALANAAVLDDDYVG